MVGVVVVAPRRVALVLGLGAGCAGSPAAMDETSSDDGAIDESSTGALIDERPVVRADSPPPPVYGGTLAISRDGTTAIASDPDRDLVHVVDLDGAVERVAIALGVGARPFRIVEDDAGSVHVALRGSGEVVTIDPDLGEIVHRRPVCPNPRGLASAGDAIIVACASGEIWWLPPTGEAPDAVIRVAPDLRDVFVGDDGVLRATRFRSAEVLQLELDGTMIDRSVPPPRADGSTFVPSTAWRTVGAPGGWLMVHQIGDTSHINVNSEGAYGHHDESCGGVVRSTATLATADGVIGLDGLPMHALAVDIAIDAAAEHAAIVVAAGCGDECTTPQLAIIDLVGFGGAHVGPCSPADTFVLGEPTAQMTSVAFTPAGDVVVQQRDPAALHVVDTDGVARSIVLSGDSVEDTGHRLFHEVGTTKVACASCHPEGGDDGLVWWLEARVHTPALYVGLADTAPYHWAGDINDFASLVTEVHERRIGALPQPPERVTALREWMNALVEPPPRREMDAEALAGRAVWDAYACHTCHGGSATTNNRTIAIDEGAELLQVPPLHGVALHPPWLHDGHGLTLEDTVREMIVRTRPGANPTAIELAALVAYLETL